MANDTAPETRDLVIYSVFVRNHTPEGTFRALIPDLPRIRALGADIVWLMPIHPVGEVSRKGTLGSPYANRDYRAVNPEYGTLDDFRALVESIHAAGMRCMIDVVYNHTSPDSVLWREHPEFFFKRPDGRPGNRVGDWTDIIDLDYGVPALWDYQIETLCAWARLVDGFRCDVASFVPAAFWKRARAAVAEIKPDFLWLAESVHRSFNGAYRRAGMYAARDVDLFEAFDMEYDYDTRDAFDRFLRGEGALSAWTDLLDFQDFAYPATYNKLRFLENHDTPRIASLVGPAALESYTAMLYFMKGATLLYAGQEAACTRRPDLFDRDTVSWDTGRDLTPLLQRLAEIKKTRLSPGDAFFARADDGHRIAVMTRDDGKARKVGVFPLRSEPARVEVELPDGLYEDLLGGGPVAVRGGALACEGRPLLLSCRIRENGALQTGADILS